MYTMDYPKFIVLNQKEESISIQKVKVLTLYIPPIFQPWHKNWQHNIPYNIVKPRTLEIQVSVRNTP